MRPIRIQHCGHHPIAIIDGFHPPGGLGIMVNINGSIWHGSIVKRAYESLAEWAPRRHV